MVSWSLRFDWSIAVSSDRRPVTLQDAIRHLSETYPDQNGIIGRTGVAAVECQRVDCLLRSAAFEYEVLE